jgi:hypothetical protein
MIIYLILHHETSRWTIENIGIWAGVVVNFLLAAVALFQDKIKFWFSRPNLCIELHRLCQYGGEDTKLQYVDSMGTYITPAQLFHAIVQNKKKGRTVHDCRVYLKTYFKFINNKWVDAEMPVPFSFCWAPKEDLKNGRISITGEQPFDFGAIIETIQSNFKILIDLPVVYKAEVDRPGKSCFQLKLEAEDFERDDFYVYVDWMNEESKYPILSLTRKPPLTTDEWY